MVTIQRMLTSAGEASCAPRVKARQRADEKGARYGPPMLRPENSICVAIGPPDATAFGGDILFPGDFRQELTHGGR
jgi:hypothetical protein